MTTQVNIVSNKGTTGRRPSYRGLGTHQELKKKGVQSPSTTDLRRLDTWQPLHSSCHLHYILMILDLSPLSRMRKKFIHACEILRNPGIKDAKERWRNLAVQPLGSSATSDWRASRMKSEFVYTYEPSLILLQIGFDTTEKYFGEEKSFHAQLDALLFLKCTGRDFQNYLKQIRPAAHRLSVSIIPKRGLEKKKKIDDIFMLLFCGFYFLLLFALGIAFFPLGRGRFSIKYKAAAILETKSWLNADFFS